MRQSIIVVIIFTLGLPLWASAETAISYQGQRPHDGDSFIGTRGMEFCLFDSLTEGSRVGDEEICPAVPAEGGLSQVELD